MTEPENTLSPPPVIPRAVTSTTSILRARAVPTFAVLCDELEAMVVREVLDRLLLLNHERYAEEVVMGLHEKGAKKGKGRKGGKGGKNGGKNGVSEGVEGDFGQGMLF